MSVQKEMKRHEVVPDLFETCDVPQLGVTFPSALDKKIKVVGEKMSARHTLYHPTLEWEVEPDSLYCIFKLDLDAPSRKNHTQRCWLHWAVVNVENPQEIDMGDELAEYVGCGAPKGSGFHRYVFVVYKQGEKFKIGKTRPLKGYGGNGAHRAAHNHQKCLGNFKTMPTMVAATMYQGEHDHSVTKLMGWLAGSNDLPKRKLSEDLPGNQTDSRKNSGANSRKTSGAAAGSRKNSGAAGSRKNSGAGSRKTSANRKGSARKGSR